MPPRTRPDVTDETKYGIRVLRLLPKCEGFDVWELQMRLLAWGSGTDNDEIGSFMDPVRVTGIFDTTTRDAVKRFQKAYKLPITGVVDDPTFRAINGQAALFPVLIHDFRCPCATRKDDPKIICRCVDPHPESGKCEGFGKKRFAGKFLLDGKKLADDTDLSTEKLDVYDMEEHDGVDKALLWAVRGLMKRAEIDRISIVAGYRCWHDNYLHTDTRHWSHRKITLNLGKAIEFQHGGRCTRHGEEIEYEYSDTGERNEIGRDRESKANCARCEEIRVAAMAKCGFQLRWQEPDRLSVAESNKKSPPPVTPFSVQIDTVRRVGRHKEDFVKTYFDSLQPAYEVAPSMFLPVDLGSGLDPRIASSQDYFANPEKKKGGWFPLGGSRTWHSGVHLYAPTGNAVHAIAPGEVIACRTGEADSAEPYGSRNFVLLRHKLKTKNWYSLYMHLDAGKAVATSLLSWRQRLHVQTLDAVEVMVPMPLFIKKEVDEYKADGTSEKKDRLVPAKGHNFGDWVATEGDAVDPLTLDTRAPKDSLVFKVADKADTYIYTKMEDKVVGERRLKTAGLDTKIAGAKVIGLDKPIKVAAGEKLGTIGAAPTDLTLNGEGSFLHVEVFAEEQLLTGDGWTLVEATDPAKAADRKAITEALVAKKLLASYDDSVLLDADLQAAGADPNNFLLRSAVLNSPSAWSIDWKAALAAATPLSFLKVVDRDKLGDDFNKYSWWTEAKPGGLLPASEVVFHYHPIAFLVQLAHT